MDVQDVLDGKVGRIEMRCSQDGGPVLTQWHEGQESGSVWSEIWTTDVDGPVCVFHGTVDRVSRRITQVG